MSPVARITATNVGSRRDPLLYCVRSFPVAMAPETPLVLLVEDFDDAREMYAEYLEFNGLRVAGAADAVRGLQLADELQPSIILMDAALPGLSGWDAIKELKANPRTSRIPILMMTGHVLGDAKERALAAGAEGFIPKPCLPDELTRQILATLRKTQISDV